MKITPIRIIPAPKNLKQLPGELIISEGVKIVDKSDRELSKESHYLAQKLSRILPEEKILFEEHKSPNNQKNIELRLTNNFDEKNSEAYSLYVHENKVLIKAGHPAGIFYGIQTFLQLLPAEVFSRQQNYPKETIAIPCLKIEDKPRFQYRGMHLDVVRHFFPVSFVKRYIDYLAYHKLNTLHLHLTDDQGWRIEIKKYPKLTKIGSVRKETIIGKTNQYDGKPYGGYYTQEEIREIVTYAQENHITVIPEIEMPGHAVAALAAYPQYSCTDGPFEVRTRWGISQDILCAGKDSTYIFIKNILKEVMDLFPSKYIHIGGDEAPKDRWENCPDCQQKMAELGLEDEEELQSHFIEEVGKFLNQHNRKLIGWDEILEGGIPEGATVMSWRGVQGGLRAAHQDHDAIMVPYSHLYFDGYQADPAIEPLAIGYWAPLKKVYNFQPIPEQLDQNQKQHILGVEATLWTEYISTPGYAEYMLMPRMSALSEIAWSPKNNRDWYSFSDRLQKQYKRYMAMEANFRIPTPQIDDMIVLDNASTVEIESSIDIGKIHYTLDGSKPSLGSPVYDDPINIDDHTLLKASTFLPNGRSSSVVNSKIMLNNNAPGGYSYGLEYKYYEDNFNSFKELENEIPRLTGSTYYFNIGDLKRRPDNFTFQFSGYLNIEKAGQYTFYLTSDDGSQLIINEKIVAETPVYIQQPITGSIYLEKGQHPITINLEDIGGAEGLHLEYESSDLPRQEIAPWNFVHKK
ncbi:MAG TPA: family 20 glycosylhydrolase [bacterium]|nr:family 20 glycosylhydrolase [bacterium]